MNFMDDLTVFVIFNATSNITANDLSYLFVQEVLLKVGFCGLVVVDNGSTFKGLFQSVYALLNISFHIAARGNHKAVGVDNFQRFLNKSVAIAANDRGTNSVFVEASHTASYAWNSSHIEGTEIIHSVPDVVQPFRFPFDLSLFPTSSPTIQQATNIRAFLSLASPFSQFSFTEERRAMHCEYANETRNLIILFAGDLVTARVQVNSNASTNTVNKLCY